MVKRARRPPVGDPNDPRGFEALMARYLEGLAVRGCSPDTLRASGSALRLFAEWCSERGIGQPVEVTRTVVERYQRWLFHLRQPSGRALTVGTQRQRLLWVRRMFAWLTEQRYLLYDPASAVPLPKKPMRLPVDGFSIAEVEQILAVPDVRTPVGLRERAILEVLYSTGIRRSELAGLDVWDVDVERGWLTIRQGKGGKDRVVPIGERALAWVMRYVEEARAELVLSPDEWALFVSLRGTRWSAGALGNRVHQIIEASGVRPRWGNCHLFRHTMATLMLEQGADVRYVQEMLGHASLETTQLYTRVSIVKLKEIHSATHPAAKLERTSVLADELTGSPLEDSSLDPPN